MQKIARVSRTFIIYVSNLCGCVSLLGNPVEILI